MTEYARTETHQFCDTELCMILDIVTGEPLRAFKGSNSIGPFTEALECVKLMKGWENRTVIVKFQCVKAFEIQHLTKGDIKCQTEMDMNVQD